MNNSQNNGSTNSSSQPTPEQMSLIGLYVNNECPCNSRIEVCKKALNEVMKVILQTKELTIADVRELTYLMKGS
jgi:hypothetical protein